MRQPIHLWIAVVTMGGVHCLAGLMFLGPSLASRAARPVVRVAEDDAALGVADKSLACFGGILIKVDIHAMCAQVEVMGDEVQNIGAIGLYRGDKAPCGRAHAR